MRLGLVALRQQLVGDTDGRADVPALGVAASAGKKGLV
jgi:hypothetical protein